MVIREREKKDVSQNRVFILFLLVLIFFFDLFCLIMALTGVFKGITALGHIQTLRKGLVHCTKPQQLAPDVLGGTLSTVNEFLLISL